MSNPLQPHRFQQTRLPCPTPIPGACSNYVHRVSEAIQSSHPPSSPSPFNFNIFHESVPRIRWPKYRTFSFSVSPSNEYSGLIWISFRIDWFDLLAVQETLRHHNSKASVFQCSAFFIVQLSYPYMTTEKTIALTRWTFAGKVMSLLFNMLSMLVIAFLARSKHLLIL